MENFYDMLPSDFARELVDMGYIDHDSAMCVYYYYMDLLGGFSLPEDRYHPNREELPYWVKFDHPAVAIFTLFEGDFLKKMGSLGRGLNTFNRMIINPEEEVDFAVDFINQFNTHNTRVAIRGLGHSVLVMTLNNPVEPYG